MTIQIIHLLPNRFPYGAYAMLDELYYALNKYYGDEIEQKVMYLYGRSDPTPEHFKIPAEHTDIKFLRRTIVKEHTNPVVFYHKLSATDCKDVSKTLHKKAPFAAVPPTTAIQPLGTCHRQTPGLVWRATSWRLPGVPSGVDIHSTTVMETQRSTFPDAGQRNPTAQRNHRSVTDWGPKAGGQTGPPKLRSTT